VTHDQKDEGVSFLETSGVIHFKWLKYKDKNSRFLFLGGGNESYINNIVYLFVFVTVTTFDSAG
jgi:hypothetical protein